MRKSFSFFMIIEKNILFLRNKFLILILYPMRKKIKICELKIGKNVQTLKIPKLNEMQDKLFKILNLDPSQMLKNL